MKMKFQQTLKAKIFHLKPSDGYIALTSAIIITILILTVTLAVSATGFFGRFNILDTTFKEQSASLAEACVEVAFLKLAENTNYAGNEQIAVNGDSCTIRQIQTLGNQKTIETTATKNEAQSNLEVVISTADFSVLSWREVANF